MSVLSFPRKFSIFPLIPVQDSSIHAMVDSTDGFASIAEDLLNYIREEQPKCGILALPLSQFQDDCVKPNANACALNDALEMSGGFNFSFPPLSFPFLPFPSLSFPIA